MKASNSRLQWRFSTISYLSMIVAQEKNEFKRKGSLVFSVSSIYDTMNMK